jgi:glycosyltransferase involved in cell wall biosynthesis
MQELSFLKLSYATVIPSPYVKQLFHRLLPRKNVFYVELGIRNFITYDNKKIEKNTNFLYVGTVESRKGIIYLIRALNLLNNKGISFHCDIVGKITENNYFLQLKTEINRFGLQDKITFQGWLSDRELSEYYSYSTCFVFPSLLEGYGMVILEAMAYGLPVISFDNSAMPFTVKDGKNGILVKNKNIEELAESLYKIITDVPFREQLSQGALETYAHFRTFKDMDKDIDAIFQSNFEISKIKYEDISD